MLLLLLGWGTEVTCGFGKERGEGKLPWKDSDLAYTLYIYLIMTIMIMIIVGEMQERGNNKTKRLT